ncbi:hypothetical protein N9W45_03905 [Nitrosopumilus sp.]|nr:hypothetical protein [Nitrosopumilus sp.]
MVLFSLVFLAPSDVFANDGNDILEIASLEHDVRQGQYNSLVQVDSDTYALAYEGKDKDGFISTFTISSDGSSIVEVDTLEHDIFNGQYNSLVQVDSDTYALAYAGTNDDGFISTFTIDSEGVITPIQIQNHANTDTVDDVANVEHDMVHGQYNSLVQINSNTIALAYAGTNDDGFISTFTIDSEGVITPIQIQNHANTDTVDDVANVEHDRHRGIHNSLVQVDSDTYALAYEGLDRDGFISTFTISSSGVITPIQIQNHANTSEEDDVANVEHDEDRASYNSLVHVVSDTYALAYTSHGEDGFISTFTIDSNGNIAAVKTQSEGNNLEHDETKGIHNSLVQVDSDTIALAYTGFDANGFISTFTISSDGSSIVEVENLEHDTDVGQYNSLVQVDSDTYALAYASSGKDGWIMTFTIPSDEIKEKTDECYDCEAPKLAKVEVHITSNTSDEIINENAPQISETRDYVWTFDQKTPYPMFEDYKTPIIADPGDEVQIILELTDNRTLKRIADSGTYTNFLQKPNDMNTFYANNFDEYGKVSTTYYEWHQTGEDLFYDYDNTVQWSPADVVIEESGELDNRVCCNQDQLAGTFTISFKMKFLQPMQTTDVWVQSTDRSGNFFKVSLPLTLKVAGNEPLVFESKVNQKVLSFYDESMLLDIVSDWTGSSQNVSELAKILGIPDEQLPPWVTNLAVWVSEDRISMGDMIVSIEHLINN